MTGFIVFFLSGNGTRELHTPFAHFAFVQRNCCFILLAILRVVVVKVRVIFQFNQSEIGLASFYLMLQIVLVLLTVMPR